MCCEWHIYSQLHDNNVDACDTLTYGGYRQAVRHEILILIFAGSNPASPVLWSLIVGCVFTRACGPEFKERATEGHGEVSGGGEDRGR